MQPGEVRDFRDGAFLELEKLMEEDSNLVLLSNDMAAAVLQRIRLAHPSRALNAGISEQNIVGVAAGLGLSGHSVFAFGIGAHMGRRCYEQIALDLAVHAVPVAILGMGAGFSYGADGPTHHALQDVAALSAIPGLEVWSPSDALAARAIVRRCHASKKPAYLRLDKEALPLLAPEVKKSELDQGFRIFGNSKNGILASYGFLTHTALAAQTLLKAEGTEVAVVDFLRVKPLDLKALEPILAPAPRTWVLEEQTRPGGVFPGLLEGFQGRDWLPRLRGKALPEQHWLGATSRTEALKAARLSAAELKDDWKRGG